MGEQQTYSGSYLKGDGPEWTPPPVSQQVIDQNKLLDQNEDIYQTKKSERISVTDRCWEQLYEEAHIDDAIISGKIVSIGNGMSDLVEHINDASQAKAIGIDPIYKYVIEANSLDEFRAMITERGLNFNSKMSEEDFLLFKQNIANGNYAPYQAEHTGYAIEPKSTDMVIVSRLISVVEGEKFIDDLFAEIQYIIKEGGSIRIPEATFVHRFGKLTLDNNDGFDKNDLSSTINNNPKALLYFMNLLDQAGYLIYSVKDYRGRIILPGPLNDKEMFRRSSYNSIIASKEIPEISIYRSKYTSEHKLVEPQIIKLIGPFNDTDEINFEEAQIDYSVYEDIAYDASNRGKTVMRDI